MAEFTVKHAKSMVEIDQAKIAADAVQSRRDHRAAIARRGEYGSTQELATWCDEGRR